MWHCQLFYAIPILRWGSWFWVAIASRQYHGSLCRRVVQQQQVGELKLAFDTDSNSITTEGYAVFTHVSCNTLSVSNTYHSNHQIGKLSKIQRTLVAWRSHISIATQYREHWEPSSSSQDHHVAFQRTRDQIITSVSWTRTWVSVLVPSLGWPETTICDNV